MEASKSDIEVKIVQEEIRAPLLTREQIIFWLHKFRGIDITKQDQRQRLIDTFLNAVYVYDEKIALTFNYKDGDKTLSLKDIESSDLFGDALPRLCQAHDTFFFEEFCRGLVILFSVVWSGRKRLAYAPPHSRTITFI